MTRNFMGVWGLVCDWGMKNLGIEDWLYLRLKRASFRASCASLIRSAFFAAFALDTPPRIDEATPAASDATPRKPTCCGLWGLNISFVFLPNWYIIGTFLAPFSPSLGSQEDLAAKIMAETISFAVVAIILLNDVNEFYLS